MPNYCTVCRNNSIQNSEVSYFLYPRDLDKAREWLEVCDRKDLLDRLEYLKRKTQRINYKICEEHFESKFIKLSGNKKCLTEDAFPTLNLPGSESSVRNRNEEGLGKTGKNKYQNSSFKDALGVIEFFTSLGRTAHSFPEDVQIRVKGEIFEVVNQAEIEVLQRKIKSNNQTEVPTAIKERLGSSSPSSNPVKPSTKLIAPLEVSQLQKCERSDGNTELEVVVLKTEVIDEEYGVREC
ncbi:52 kDa repressor of the inhibitor of the protein kinase-like [Ostrinia furnacalis]|uniref:52 kDa repressor of the inhibitor of the protein kinase-like n=1 Tax=Ostrinia furnacalis TaxID=93504 RepID=UPI00103E6631|nr:52 kDa repressor of the inhibitor of the protein kinase-like [Ostrinia furnacalis]